MHIVHIISSLQIGGAERVLCMLADEFKKREHRQSVIYFHDGPLRTEIESLGIKTYQITGYFCRYDPWFIFKLIKQLYVLKPDILHCALWAANFLGAFCARIFSIPSVCVIHAQRTVEGTVRNLLDRLALGRAHAVITITSTIKEQLITQKIILPAKISVIENGVDAQELQAASSRSTITRQSLGVTDSDFIIGSVGRFVPVKNYPFLLNSIAELLLQHDALHLMLVGIGPEYESLKQIAIQLHIDDKVHFIVGQPSIEYYHLFDCFVSASTCEALSLAILEAMSLQIPCIVHGEHYYNILKNNEEALIITNSSELRSAILNYYGDAVLVSRIKKNALQLIEKNYSFEKTATRYQKVFEERVANYNR